MKPKEIVQIRDRLIQWYKTHHRQLPWRGAGDPYHIWVSEVMLQQTQVRTVIPYYQRFLECFPDLASLARADLQDVLKLWEGLGYYARARNLHRAANMVLTEHDGEVPDNFEGFRRLPGVGDYIASAVQSIAFDGVHAVADGNVKRVLARVFQTDAAVNQSRSHKWFRETAGRLMGSSPPGLFNQAMMELGALICKPRHPECGICPIRSFCLAFQNGKVGEYPKRIKGKPTPECHVAAGVVRKKGRMLITRRKPEGLLGGLWEFPGGKVWEKETPEQACIREIREETNLVIGIDSHLTRVRHAYTHFKIFMDVFLCHHVSGRVRLDGPVDFRWIRLNEIDTYPFPKADLKFIPLLKEE